MSELRRIINSMKPGEVRDLGGGHSLTKGPAWDEFWALVEAERKTQSDTGGDNDGGQENPTGDTEDGVKHG